MKKLILLLVIAVSLIFTTFAGGIKVSKKEMNSQKNHNLNQTGSLQGKVTAKSDKEAVPFANVVIEQNGKQIAGTACDMDGRYRISNINAGKYNLTVSMVGFKKMMITNLIISSQKITFQNIVLEEDVQLLEAVEIINYQIPLISKDQTSSGGTMTSDAIMKMPGRTANSVAVTVGGVFSRSGSMGSVRGSRSQGTVTYIDGIKVRGAKNNSTSSSKASVTQQTATDAAERKYNNKLTATELNDFSKWELWKDIAENDLKKYESMWQMSPKFRYAVQVLGENSVPVIDAQVLLKNKSDVVLWKARTDNTGKTELWLNMFKEEESKNLIIEVKHKGESFYKENPGLFDTGINIIKIPAACHVPENIDIAFVVDATGSMDDEIDFLKSDLVDIIQKTKSVFPEVVLNMGSVFYRCYGNSYVTKLSQMSIEESEIVGFIKAQSAAEGGAEVVEEGLKVAIENLQWSENARARLLFLILDEQPLTKQNVINMMHSNLKNAATKGIRIIPIVASAETISNAKSLEYIMRCLALGTNGTYVALTDHSKIGNKHATPSTDKFNVELLNTLIKRIIYQFSYAEDCDKKASAKELAEIKKFSKSRIITTEIIYKNTLSKSKTPQISLVEDYTDYTYDVDEEISENIDDIAGNNNSKISSKNKLKAALNCYPNPTTGILNISMSHKAEEVFITDIGGKIIEKVKVDTKHFIADISSYSTGIYFVRILSKGEWYSEKIVLIR